MFLKNLDYLIFMIMILTGILVFVSMRKHLLVTLLSLEYLVLCVFVFFVFFVLMFLGEMYLIMMFLTFSVCEGVLGLSILVSLIRTHGNDYISSLFYTKW